MAMAGVNNNALSRTEDVEYERDFVTHARGVVLAFDDNKVVAPVAVGWMANAS